MPRWAWNKAPAESKRRFFELIRQGASGLEASAAVGVSPSCGSLWFIDAGRVDFLERPISGRYLSQDDRIEIADDLPSRIGCGRWSRTSCLGTGRRARSADGCVDAGRADRRGI
jgi:hypothetical protein